MFIFMMLLIAVLILVIIYFINDLNKTGNGKSLAWVLVFFIVMMISIPITMRFL